MYCLLDKQTIKHVTVATTLASVRCCSVQSLSIVMWCYPPAVQKKLDQVWQLGMFPCKPFQWPALPPHLYGKISYCAFIALFSKKIGNQTRNRLTECNLWTMVKLISSLFSFYTLPYSFGTLSKYMHIKHVSSCLHYLETFTCCKANN